MGAPQHLHPLHVEQLLAQAVQASHIGLVHIDGDGGFQGVNEVVLRDAANVEDDERRRVGEELQARRLLGDLGGVRHPELLQLFAAEGRDRDAHILYVLLPLLRGDDDFFQHLRCSVDWNQQRQERKGLEKGSPG